VVDTHAKAKREQRKGASNTRRVSILTFSKHPLESSRHVTHHGAHPKMLGPGLLFLATISGCPPRAYCGLGLGRLSSPSAAAGPGLIVRPGAGEPRPPMSYAAPGPGLTRPGPGDPRPVSYATPGPGLLLRAPGGYVLIGMLSCPSTEPSLNVCGMGPRYGS